MLFFQIEGHKHYWSSEKYHYFCKCLLFHPHLGLLKISKYKKIQIINFFELLYLSIALGAKQLVVEKMHAMFSLFNSEIFKFNIFKSVLNSSPTRIFSIMTGVNPLAITDLMHDFWSILGIKTYLARGFVCRMESIQNVSVMPVAIGMMAHFFINVRPLILSKSTTSSFVNLLNIEEPTAFGWTSVISPLRPIPCEKW